MRTLNKFLATATVWKSAPDYPAKDLKLEKNDDGGSGEWYIFQRNCKNLSITRSVPLWGAVDRQWQHQTKATIPKCTEPFLYDTTHLRSSKARGINWQYTKYTKSTEDVILIAQGTLNDFKVARMLRAALAENLDLCQMQDDTLTPPPEGSALCDKGPVQSSASPICEHFESERRGNI